jgi:hypothetical protein
MSTGDAPVTMTPAEVAAAMPTKATTQRDELARVIFDAPALIAWDNKSQHVIADAILAAGWSKPRTVTTVAELDALPRYSVIRTHLDEVYTKHYDFYEESDNWEARDRISIHSGDMPATVLFTPEATL